eukprot:s244_g32.t1
MCCQKRCKTKGGEGAHLFRTHGIIAAERWLYDGTSCPHCLKEFHTYAKLQGHLRRTDACRLALHGLRRHPQPAPGRGSRANELLHQRHDGLLPVQQAQGPPALRGLPGVEDAHHIELYEAMALLCVDHQDHPDQDLFAALQDLVYKFPIGWSSAKATFAYMRDTVTEDDAQLAGLDLAHWRRILGQLSDSRHWPFLVDDVTQDALDSDLTLELLEQWCYDCADHPAGYAPRVVHPAHHFKERVLVHAFSGRRRHGDLQWFLEDLAAKRGDTDLYVVSLDLVIDPLWGDIGRHETYTFWMHALKSGYVLGFLAGPPCCTWSIARGKEDATLQASGRRGPRRVRSLEDIWGFWSLSIKEKKQIMDGHQLLAFSIIAMVLLHHCGGHGILEHPAEPLDPLAASIWRLPLMQLILTLSGFSRVTLAQGLLGASSVKSTCLLTLNMAPLPACIRKYAVCTDLPKGKSIGLAEDGSFKTSILKEYPPAFCGSMAEAFYACFSQATPGRQSVPAEVMDTFTAMISSEMGERIGPDYARG